MFQSGSVLFVPMYSMKEAKPSLSHSPSHQAMVTRLPNHCIYHKCTWKWEIMTLRKILKKKLEYTCTKRLFSTHQPHRSQDHWSTKRQVTTAHQEPILIYHTRLTTAHNIHLNWSSAWPHCMEGTGSRMTSLRELHTTTIHVVFVLCGDMLDITHHVVLPYTCMSPACTHFDHCIHQTRPKSVGHSLVKW